MIFGPIEIGLCFVQIFRIRNNNVIGNKVKSKGKTSIFISKDSDRLSPKPAVPSRILGFRRIQDQTGPNCHFIMEAPLSNGSNITL